DGARVRFDRPAGAVDRHIRAMTDAPGAWVPLGDARLKLGPVTVETEPVGLAAGELHVTKRAVFVGTATAALRLGSVQPPGKKPMPAADWARGARIEDGTIIGVEQ
ncbi:methionyl-tRNA formyltransferase, partial [Tsukamurella pulmonis]